MLSDIEIAQAAKMLPIAKVAEKLGLADEDLIPYGRYKAKINHKLIHSDRPDGKLNATATALHGGALVRGDAVLMRFGADDIEMYTKAEAQAVVQVLHNVM